METIDPRGMAKFDPRGMIGIMGLVVSEKKIIFSFSYCRSMETIDPRGVAKFDPRGMAGTIYVEDH